MNYYPVLIPTLNRYEHFKECVESLAACTHADKTELVIGLDYPPSEKYVEGWKKIKNYLPTITGFRKVTIFEHDHNLGIGNNGNGAFLREYVKKHYDAWIGTEDDNVFSPCFLDYMNKCLDKYKDDKDILLVCGCLEPDIKDLLDSSISQMNGNILKIIGNASAYGCGHWKKKDDYLREVFPVDIKRYVFNSRKNIVKLLKAPGKLHHIYFWIKRYPNLNCICDFTRNAWMVLNNKCNILPAISLVRNNGFDGSGIYCCESDDIMKLWENNPISNNKYYEIEDLITKKQINNFSRILFKSIPNKEKKEILPIIILCLIFGYDISEKILKFNDCMKINIKNKIKQLLKINKKR